MPLDLAVLKTWPFERREQTYTDSDSIRYALSVGVGSDPMSEEQLSFVVAGGSSVVPTMATVLCNPGPWTSDPRTGVTRSRLVHSEQTLRLYRPIPRSATVTSQARVTAVVDRGEAKGATIYVVRDLRLAGSSECLAELGSMVTCRADGGFGGSDTPAWSLPSVPGRAADVNELVPTARSAALLYQLNGDYNPLHTSPAYARSAGFERPILHGLCSYGMVCQALMGATHSSAENVHGIGARFTAPVYPGDTLRIEAWDDTDGYVFRVWAAERNTKVIDNGYLRMNTTLPRP